MSVAVANSALGEWLTTQIRASKAKTQNAVALYCGVSNSAISEWARGLRTPDPRYCWKLAEYFGTPVEDVMRMAGHLPPAEERDDEPRVPAWLEEILPILREFDAYDQESLKASALTLREVRPLREAYDAGPPDPADPE